MMVMSGFTYGARKLKDGSFTWHVARHGEEIFSGTATTKEDTQAAVKKALAEAVVMASEKSVDRARLQMSMKRFLKTRIYLTSYVFHAAATGVPASEFIAGAAEGEKDWHDREAKRVGAAWPIPSHHRTLPASAAAEKIFDLMEQLGLNTPKQIMAYAKKHIGTAWAQGGNLETLEEMDAAAEKAKREDNAKSRRKA